jgi:hypothetical protein
MPRNNSEEERLTEDEIARRKLGPRGVPGGEDSAKMTRARYAPSNGLSPELRRLLKQIFCSDGLRDSVRRPHRSHEMWLTDDEPRRNGRNFASLPNPLNSTTSKPSLLHISHWRSLP